LTETLIGAGYESGKKESLTLPGVLAKLSRVDVESFTALQPTSGAGEDAYAAKIIKYKQLSAILAILKYSFSDSGPNLRPCALIILSFNFCFFIC
jgi:hypothetical protein